MEKNRKINNRGGTIIRDLWVVFDSRDKVGGEMALDHIRHVLQTKIGAMRDPMKLNFEISITNE